MVDTDSWLDNYLLMTDRLFLSAINQLELQVIMINYYANRYHQWITIAKKNYQPVLPLWLLVNRNTHVDRNTQNPNKRRPVFPIRKRNKKMLPKIDCTSSWTHGGSQKSLMDLIRSNCLHTNLITSIGTSCYPVPHQAIRCKKPPLPVPATVLGLVVSKLVISYAASWN